MPEPLITVRGLTKSFAGRPVVKDVSVEFARGEFVGLMGPNGAGKSTFIKMLSGVYTPDAGSISLAGRQVPSLAGRAEIGFIHQDLGLVDQLSVLDNLRLGLAPARRFGPVLDRSGEQRLAEEALALVGMDVSPAAEVGTLSPGEKAMLATARLLQQGAQFIVVDETTSTLPPREAAWFVERLRTATQAGTTVLMVSHKLSELLSAAQRVVMLIDGKLVADRPVTPADRSDVVRMLAAHEEEKPSGQEAASSQEGAGKTLLTMENVTYRGVGPIDLELRQGEVLGITGLIGSGLHTLGLLAHGALHPTGGTVRRDADVVSAIVAPQRESHGIIGAESVLWNCTLSSLHRWRSRTGLLRLTAERRDAIEAMRELAVVPADPDVAIGTLSGGNQQKVLFARALLRNADVYVLCEPTRGVDIGTRRAIYDLIVDLRRRGAAILVVTSDSEDLFAVCDRIGVLEPTGIAETWRTTELSENELTELL